MSEPVLTKRELAKRLKVSPRTIERINPPHIRVGGQNRYHLSEVKRHLAGVPNTGGKVVPFPTRGEAA